MSDEPAAQPTTPLPTLAAMSSTGSLSRGVLVGFGLNLGGMFVSTAVGSSIMNGGLSDQETMDAASLPFLAIALCIGLTQLLWIIPLYLRYKRTFETETAKGLVIAATLTFLLNAGCLGLLLSGGMR